MGLLDGKVAVVTGAGHGIGRGEALELARQGAKVVVNDVGGSVHGEGVDKRAGRGGGRDHPRAAAARRPPTTTTWPTGRVRKAWCDQAVDEFGRLDVLVNNAGIVRDAMLFSMSEDDFDAVVRVHLKGTFATTHHASVYWREESKAGRQPRAAIVNTVSSAGLQGNVGQANYGAAKAGIAALTVISSLELSRYGVRANAVAPGGMTRITATLAQGRRGASSPTSSTRASTTRMNPAQLRPHGGLAGLGRGRSTSPARSSGPWGIASPTTSPGRSARRSSPRASPRAGTRATSAPRSTRTSSLPPGPADGRLSQRGARRGDTLRDRRAGRRGGDMAGVWSYEGKRVLVSGGGGAGMGAAAVRGPARARRRGPRLRRQGAGLGRGQLTGRSTCATRRPSTSSRGQGLGGEIHALFNCAGLPGPPFSGTDVMLVNFVAARHLTDPWPPSTCRSGSAVCTISSAGAFGWEERHGPGGRARWPPPGYAEARRWCEDHPDAVGEGYLLSKQAIIVWTHARRARPRPARASGSTASSPGPDPDADDAVVRGLHGQGLHGPVPQAPGRAQFDARGAGSPGGVPQQRRGDLRHRGEPVLRRRLLGGHAHRPPRLLGAVGRDRRPSPA